MSFIVEQSVKVNQTRCKPDSQIGHPIIGITINYRLGPFGFLASKEVLEEKPGNAGLRDQRQALQWIS